MRYFYDCEFIEDGRTIDLVSIGIVADNGREYYAVNRDMPVRRIRKHKWLMDNVVPSLPKGQGDRRNHVPRRWLFDYADPIVKPRKQIAREVADFILNSERALTGMLPDVELWADYGAYDHVVLCQLWGPMIALPEGMPMWTHDIQQEARRRGVTKHLPQQAEGEHNALADARHVKARWECLQRPFITVEQFDSAPVEDKMERLLDQHGT